MTQEIEQGIFIRGVYLGVEESRTWKPNGDDGREVTVKPKIGIEVNGEEVSVSAKDDQHLAEARKGLVKGDTIELLVDVRPPYGSKGSVGFFLPGAVESRRREWK